MPLIHHELCFGCGRTNLFGLLLDVQELESGAVAGRCFIKQDHQGADRGVAHDGIVGAALSEAMALACGLQARARWIEVQFTAPADVGSFVDVTARVTARDATHAQASATACSEGRTVATARGRYEAAAPPPCA